MKFIIVFLIRPSPFFRLLSNAFSDFGSVGRRRKKKSLETTRCGYKVNMAAMEEGKIDVVVKLKRE